MSPNHIEIENHADLQSPRTFLASPHILHPQTNLQQKERPILWQGSWTLGILKNIEGLSLILVSEGSALLFILFSLQKWNLSKKILQKALEINFLIFSKVVQEVTWSQTWLLYLDQFWKSGFSSSFYKMALKMISGVCASFLR